MLLVNGVSGLPKQAFRLFGELTSPVPGEYSWLSCPHALDNGDVARGRDDSGQSETVGSEELPVLRLGPLEAPEQDHHVQVEQLAERRPVPFRQHVLHEQEFRPSRHRAAKVVEYQSGLDVIPVVDDVPEHVGVGAAGGCLEEVAAFEGAPASDAGRLQRRARSTTCG